MAIIMPRLIPRGGANLNTGIVYENLEEMIQRAMSDNGGRLPLTLPDTPGPDGKTDFATVKLDSIIGYIVKVRNDSVLAALNPLGADMFISGKLLHKGVQFHYHVSDMSSNVVDRVIKASITYLPPIMTIEEIPYHMIRRNKS